ncbi:hypothetical protein CKO15_11145 [Halorhodospira abdelmalekii]|uniref:hypothetical protein n=1 Tax=Halorhodospira abdelmalekii TaxID=421629 RepID=UPI0019088C1C|nr:hypothetical protein [Halorhodospira abdelmalekii]MBK1735822.1 hypothetical protein [Halorhodospira abdelmalekii]
MNFDDVMKSTNGPAYEKEEIRNGPPLEYVGEKLKSSLEQQHELLNNINACVPDGLPLPPEYSEDCPLSVKPDFLVSPAFASFYYQIIAFAALFNMLGSVSSSTEVQRLAEMPRSEFRKWLNIIEGEGSVSGK